MNLKLGEYCIICRSRNLKSIIENGRRYFLCENGHKEPRAIIINNKTKTEFIGNKTKHFTAGAIIEKNGKYLLIERVNYPFGFAGIAGHIDYNETPEQAIEREIEEETNLDVVSCKLLFHKILKWNKCLLGADMHEWFLFKCKVKGELVKDEESKRIEWFSKEQIKKLELEESYKYWFRKLGII